MEQTSTTRPAWTKDYRDLEGRTVRLLVDRNIGHTEGGTWVKDGVIPAGTIGRASDRCNAGFRGLEWRFTATDGRRVFGVSGCWLQPMP